jgi:hypothetical protein
MLDRGAAYGEGYGRATPIIPDTTELGAAGDISNLNVVPGRHKWSTTVTFTALNLVGSATDVWIMQIAGSLILTSGTGLTLSGGARAANIFWMVAGSVTVAGGLHLEGIIVSAGLISFAEGASLVGRALSATQVTLVNNSISPPPPPACTYGGSCSATTCDTSGSLFRSNMPCTGPTTQPCDAPVCCTYGSCSATSCGTSGTRSRSNEPCTGPTTQPCDTPLCACDYNGSVCSETACNTSGTLVPNVLPCLGDQTRPCTNALCACSFAGASCSVTTCGSTGVRTATNAAACAGSTTQTCSTAACPDCSFNGASCDGTTGCGTAGTQTASNAGACTGSNTQACSEPACGVVRSGCACDFFLCAPLSIIVFAFELIHLPTRFSHALAVQLHQSAVRRHERVRHAGHADGEQRG